MNLLNFSLNKGAVLGLLLIIFTFILHFLDAIQNQMLASMAWLIVIGGIVWAHSEYKKQNEGFMSYSQGLGIGVLVSLIGGLIVSVFSALLMHFIDPTILKNILNQTRRKLEQDPRMTDEIIEQTMSITETMMQPHWLIIISLISYLIVGLILSLIIAAFTKKTPETPFA